MPTTPSHYPASAFSRRSLLRWGGGLVAIGSNWPRPRHAMAAPAGATAPPQAPQHGRAPGLDATAGTAKSCILVYLLGGPSQLDSFDLKPDAPAEIRGPFRPIATSVPGIDICEHLPRLARLADRYALVRSVSHPNSNHTPMIYYTLTGHATAQPAVDNDVRPPQPDDFPHLGSVIARFTSRRGTLPPFVAIPELAIRSSIEGQYKRARSPLRGGSAGFLGAEFDPLCVPGTPGTREAIPALVPPDDVSLDRLAARATLLDLLERGRPGLVRGADFQALRQQALWLTGSSAAAGTRPFSLDDEPASLRERYGQNRFGESLLLARRLTEAGVACVTIHFNEMTRCDGWDTHSKNFDALETELLPLLDQGLSALLDDLHARGRLSETLVVCQGEFGRTPKINADAGRDHWGPCSTTFLAGGPIQGGQVWGRSDRQAAFPLADRVDPVDLHATIHHALGLPRESGLVDALGRPFQLSEGRVLAGLF